MFQSTISIHSSIVSSLSWKTLRKKENQVISFTLKPLRQNKDYSFDLKFIPEASFRNNTHLSTNQKWWRNIQKMKNTFLSLFSWSTVLSPILNKNTNLFSTVTTMKENLLSDSFKVNLTWAFAGAMITLSKLVNSTRKATTIKILTFLRSPSRLLPVPTTKQPRISWRS